MGRGRAPCCEKVGLNKGTWTAEEDMKLIAYIQKYGHQNWRALPKLAGLLRCGKSCRLRWINYLRPDIKRGNFTEEEEETIIKLHALLGNKWSKIASCLPGRTDNEIKNVWNTHLKKRLASREQQQQQQATKKTEEAPSGAASTSSASDRGEGLEVEVEVIEIPVDPTINMLDDALSTSSMLSPCSLSSSVFFETNHQMLHDIDQEEDNYNYHLSPIPCDAVIEPEMIWEQLFEDGEAGTGSVEELGDQTSCREEEGKSKEWLDYLEKELGLGDDEDKRQCMLRDGGAEELGELEGDPVSSYFQTLNFSPPPPPPL